MAQSPQQQHATFSDLPPELWDHIATYLPTARSVAALSRTNKSLHAFVEKDAWKSFARQHFPTLCSPDVPLSRDAARTLTSASRAWDRRAFVAAYIEPSHDITSFPGGEKLGKWKRPRGQTIGFTPLIDVYEDIQGGAWQNRRETLAFSAGAEICIRHTMRRRGSKDVKWATYRPRAAREGQDDITTMHLIRPDDQTGEERQHIITGTARGDLHLLGIPQDDPYDQDVRTTYFATQGMPVRSSSLLQERFRPTLLAANLGDSRIALFEVDSEQSKICASSQFDLKSVLRPDGNPSPHHRAWSTNFLSRTALAVGAGPSKEPIHIYPIAEDGLSRDGVRKFSLQNDDGLDGKRSTSNVYTMVPLPPSNGSSGSDHVFLSGAYDGVVRLHDLRSGRDVEHAYVDPADDSAVYTILCRGQEKLVTGTSRHNLCKIFDLRLGAKCYSYTDVEDQRHDGCDSTTAENDFNLFLRPSNNASFTARGSDWSRNGRQGSLESSVYSLASASAQSPYIYAGVENAVMSLAFTEVLDRHPDPTFFEPWLVATRGRDMVVRNGSEEVLNLAMYDQDANMKLSVQRSCWETWRAKAPKSEHATRERGRLDERWRGANEFGP